MGIILLHSRFWDWSSHEAETKGLPMLFIEPTTTVYGPGGRSIRLDPNPLSMFIFNEIPADSKNRIEANFETWKRTYRYPRRVASDLTWDEPNITEDYDALNECVQSSFSW